VALLLHRKEHGEPVHASDRAGYVDDDAELIPRPDPSEPGELEEVDAMDLKNAENVAPLESLPLLGADGYIIKGLSNLLTAGPKFGKTELIYQSMKVWLQRGETVLYFTEEPKLVWQQRLKMLDIIDQRGLVLVFALGIDAADLLKRVAAGSETVVVVDTLRGLGVLGEEENDNSAVARAVEPWLTTCRQGKTFLGVHHDRKSGGTHGRGVSGAHALVGAVDIVLQVRHGQKDNQRIVSAIGRLTSPPELIYERLPDGAMQVAHGELAALASRATQPKADPLSFLPTEPPGMTFDAFTKAARITNTTALELLNGSPDVARDGMGKRGNPFRYRRR